MSYWGQVQSGHLGKVINIAKNSIIYYKKLRKRLNEQKCVQLKQPTII